MKKILFLLFAVCLFSACSSDDDNNEPAKDALTLTRWQQKIDNTTYTFLFSTNNYCTYHRQVESFTPFESKYKYRLEGNKVIIHRMMETTALATGTLKDDIITISFDDVDLTLNQVPLVNY